MRTPVRTRSPTPINPLAVLLGSEDVGASFAPVREAMGDFDGFVKPVVGGIHAALGSRRAFEREIAVQLHHGVPGLHGSYA